MAWTCATCAREHDGPAFSWSYGSPAVWEPRHPEDYLDADRCVWRDDGGTRCFFLRCTLEIPMLGSEDPFVWGVWGSLSEASFERALDLWDDDERAGEGFFSWLVNDLPGYPSTLSLPCDMELRGSGVRPLLVVHPDSGHVLASAQAEGIDEHEALRLAAAAAHHAGT